MIGVVLSSKLQKRSQMFKSIVFMLEVFSAGINYYVEPINKIIIKISKDIAYEKLDFIKQCNEMLKNGYDFPNAWEISINNSALPIRKNEKQELINFGLNIGKTDISGQNKILNMYNSSFLAFSKKADEEKSKYSTPISAICFLIGSLLFIMLL